MSRTENSPDPRRFLFQDTWTGIPKLQQHPRLGSAALQLPRLPKHGTEERLVDAPLRLPNLAISPSRCFLRIVGGSDWPRSVAAHTSSEGAPGVPSGLDGYCIPRCKPGAVIGRSSRSHARRRRSERHVGVLREFSFLVAQALRDASRMVPARFLCLMGYDTTCTVLASRHKKCPVTEIFTTPSRQRTAP